MVAGVGTAPLCRPPPGLDPSFNGMWSRSYHGSVRKNRSKVRVLILLLMEYGLGHEDIQLLEPVDDLKLS